MDKKRKEGLSGGRLPREELQAGFGDIHPPLTKPQAAIEAERCYFCYDAPCIAACPTGIDIPSFIKRIATGDPSSSAKKIFEENIFGGTCARVCPTETLCEEACVRNLNESKPVKIGLLQRHATDHSMALGEQFFTRGEPSGKTVAVAGAGPASLACAHRLAMLGHAVKVYEARPRPGGLNEYGIAAYKVVDEFAQREVDYILAIGGIAVIHDATPSLEQLRADHDAVFLGIGLGGARELGIEGSSLRGVSSAISFIENLRQADDLADVGVGSKVVVIGGGMTAVDAASQTLRLGAQEATLVFRRGPDNLSASDKEIQFVQTTGALVRYWATPRRLLGADAVEGVEFEYTSLVDGKLVGTGDTYTIAADMVLTAVGQVLVPDSVDGAELLDMDGGKLAVNAERQTSLAGVWAGGDCVAGGQDLTVGAVEDGKVAAQAIDRHLREA